MAKSCRSFWAATTLLVIGLLLFTTGCTNNGDDEKTLTPTSDLQVLTKPTGGNFTWLWRDPLTLDPALAADGTSTRVIIEIFSGLVTIEGQGQELALVPDLAQDWSISDDGVTYTFQLREGASFHSGKLITAEDIKYSMERALNPATGSSVASLFLGDILGAKEYAEGIGNEVEGIIVKGPREVEFTLEGPRSYFLSKLTHPVAFVLDKENVQTGSNWTRAPNGSGPFKLDVWDIGERIILKRNDHYYRRVPFLDSVTLLLAGGSSMLMYEAGEVDAVLVDPLDLDRVKNEQDPLNKELLPARSDFSITYIAFNNGSPPFDDPKVRQAFNHAIDKESIANFVGQGLIRPAYGILPPEFPGHNDRLTGLIFDVDKARKLLQESRYGDSGEMPRITLSVPTGAEGTPPEIVAIVEMWRKNLGVAVDIELVEFGTFLQQMFQGKLQAFNLQWIPDYPDPHAFIDLLFHSESTNNTIGYGNPEVDEIIQKARESTSLDERIELYQRAEALIVIDAPWVPLWFSGEKLYLVKPWVHGFQPLPLFAPMFDDIYIEEN